MLRRCSVWCFPELTDELSRQDTNVDFDVPLRPLRDPALNVICPIKLLLAQALRSGNIGSLDDALTQASLRTDGVVQWCFPERPVVPQLIRSGAFISWDLPGRPGQLDQSTKQLALLSGILANVVSHDLRRGAFRDLANAKRSPSDEPIGVATREVARIAGHSATTFLKGTTDQYVGEAERETFNARAEQRFESRKAPAIGNPYTKRKLAEDEIEDYCREQDLDPTLKKDRRRALHFLHLKDQQDWIASEKAKPRTPSVSTPTTPPSSIIAATPGSSNATPPSALVEAPPTTETSPTRTSPTTSDDPSMMIDPRLLALDGVEVAVDGPAADRIESRAYSAGGGAGEDDQAMGLDILLENAHAHASGTNRMLTLPGREFVEALSRINVVRNVPLQDGGKDALGDNIPRLCPVGNSRDYPTLYTYKCTMCNVYTTQRFAYLRTHQIACKGGEGQREKQQRDKVCLRPV